MKMIVIDGQGGKMGRAVVEQLKSRFPQQELIALGPNSIATSSMMKAGADAGATGENPILLNSRDADVIIGPIGIVIAGSLLGEITAGMAAAVGESPAKKILIPVNNKNHCHHLIVGCQPLALGEYIKLVCDEVEKLLKQ